MSYENCDETDFLIPNNEITAFLMSKFPITSIAMNKSKNKSTINILFAENSKIENPNYSFLKSFVPFLKKQPKLIYFEKPTSKYVLENILIVLSNLSIEHIEVIHNHCYNFTIQYNNERKIISDKLKRF
jgi:hypothetical protein